MPASRSTTSTLGEHPMTRTSSLPAWKSNVRSGSPNLARRTKSRLLDRTALVSMFTRCILPSWRHLNTLGPRGLVHSRRQISPDALHRLNAARDDAGRNKLGDRGTVGVAVALDSQK